MPPGGLQVHHITRSASFVPGVCCQRHRVPAVGCSEPVSLGISCGENMYTCDTATCAHVCRSYAGFNNKGGVAVEHMVQLANMVGAAPW